MTDRSKWSITISGGNNINNQGNIFRENSIGGIINTGFQKTCLICQETAGLGYSDNCQCEKESRCYKHCQSSDNNKQNCSCQKEKQISKFKEKSTQSKDDEEFEELLKKSRYAVDNSIKIIEKNKKDTQFLKTKIKQLNLKETLREKLDQEIKNIKKIEVFSTWFNESCALVINKEKTLSQKSIYNLWVVICEPSFGKVKERINYFKVVKEITTIKENWVKVLENFQKDLNSDYPAAEIINNVYTTDLPSLTQNYENIAKSKIRVSSQSNLDDYIKPLDIVRVDRKRGAYQHVAIYLGSRKVVHINNPLGKGSSWVRIDDWEVFLGNETEIEVHHPFIPFKRSELIRKHIEIAEKARYGEGKYSLIDSNCEHFATMCVYGIGICQQKNINTVNKVVKNSNYLLQAIQESNQFFEELKKRFEIEPQKNEINISTTNNWNNIHPQFTLGLVKQWQSRDFTAQQCKEWINIGLQPTDANFCAWLRDIKQVDSTRVLNNGNLEELKIEFGEYQQWQSYIQILPK